MNAGQHAWVPVLLDMSNQPELYAEGRPVATHESMNFCRSSKWCDRDSLCSVCLLLKHHGKVSRWCCRTFAQRRQDAANIAMV